MTHREFGTSSAPLQGSCWKDRLGSWTVYAAAASAALATVTSADADIVYSGPVNLTVSVPVSVKGTFFSEKNFSIAGVAQPIFVGGLLRTIRSVQEGEVAFGAIGLDFITSGPTPRYGPAKKYALSQPILGSGSPQPAPVLRIRSKSGTSFNRYFRTNGFFGPGTVDGFVGFLTPNTNTSKRIKGWIHVEVFDRNHDGFPDQAEIIDFAYNSTPGGPINAGQTQSATPEPGSLSLALLGGGAAGIAAWRRRKKDVA